MEMLKLGQLVKHTKTKHIGIIIDINQSDRRNILEIIRGILYTFSPKNLFYSLECTKMGLAFWESFWDSWENIYLIKVLFEKGDIEYPMQDWESLTEEELDAYVREKGPLLGFTWVPVEN